MAYRLQLISFEARLKIAAVAATAAAANGRSPAGCGSASRLPQSRRLRPQPGRRAVRLRRPPQDCRSRGDCGSSPGRAVCRRGNRLKIAAVAATAAKTRGRTANNRI